MQNLKSHIIRWVFLSVGKEENELGVKYEIRTIQRDFAASDFIAGAIRHWRSWSECL
jgi:hypothetical protein